jgi:hypothetical protein
VTGSILEIMAALLAASALLMLGWFLFGKLLLPAGRDGTPVYAVVPARGRGEGLEHTIDGLFWLLGSDLARFTIVVADGGLDREGLAAVRALSRGRQNVVVCPMAELEGYLIKETTKDETL